jgi:hypothetical protein
MYSLESPTNSLDVDVGMRLEWLLSRRGDQEAGFVKWQLRSSYTEHS